MDATIKNPGFLLTAAQSSPTGESPSPRRRKPRAEEGQRERGQPSRAAGEELGGSDVALNYSVHEPTGRIVVKMVDRKTGEVIRQLPPSELLSLAEEMEKLEGILFDLKM
jgi:flagellar protein FlaG